MDFRRNPELSRYELLDGNDVVAFAEYVERSDAVVFPHTVVLPHLRGRGLGASVVRQALDDVRTSGKRVIATCWYVADFIDANPDYRDLLSA